MHGSQRDWTAVLVLNCSLALLAASPAAAAVLELRDGSAWSGEFRGASEQSMHFETSEGVRVVPIDQVRALRFGESAHAPVASAEPAAAPRPLPAAPASGSTPAAKGPAAPAAAPARASAPVARRVQIPAGTKLRVRIADSIDPRHSTEGDRFSALLETPLVAGGVAVVPARSIAYGLITAASLTGPVAKQLELELTELQIAGQPVAIVTGTQSRVGAQGEDAQGQEAPANAAPVEARIAGGSVLEFRLLQPLELVVRPR